jgi:16S rRNA (guanine527-N7)-methyltransferase
VFNSDELVDTAFRERLLGQAATAGISLDLNQLGHFEHYFRLLRQWNRTINLTALPLTDFPDRTLNRLFIEPLQAAQFVEDASLLWFDLGSGGGSPAIPLKIVRPQLRLTMVESKSRKAAFLCEVVRSLILTATDVVTVRIEELTRLVPRGQADLLTIRAVRIQEDLLQTVAGLLRPGGRLLLFGSESVPSLSHSEFRVVGRLSLAGGDSTLQVLSRVG